MIKNFSSSAYRRYIFFLYTNVISTQFQEFEGNTDNNTVKENELESMVTARFIRFIPTKWNFGPNARSCMRVEIYECLPVKGIDILYRYAHFRVTVLTSCLKVSYMYCTSCNKHLECCSNFPHSRFCCVVFCYYIFSCFDLYFF